MLSVLYNSPPQTEIRSFVEKQLEEAEGTIVEGTLKNVLKMPLNLFNKQLGEGPSVSLGTTNPRPSFSPHDIFKTENFFDK